MKSVCIIGAGLCGGYLAKELLINKNLKIKVIDIDSINDKFKSKILKNIYSNNHNNITFIDKIIKGYGFGGNSNYWHGGLTEFDDFDLNKLDFFLDYNFSTELKKYYIETWKSLDIENVSINHLNYKSLYKIFKKSGYFNFKKILLQYSPLKTRSILHKLKNKKNLELIENAICLNLNKDKEKKIKSITIFSEGLLKEIKSDYFVLASGSFETPRILLQSTNHGNLKLNNKNIGCNLIDHPFLKIGEIKNIFKTKTKLNYYKNNISNNISLRLAFSFVEDLKNNKLNHSLVLRPHINNEVIEIKANLKKYFNDRNYKNLLKLLIVKLYRFDLFFKLIKLILINKINSGSKVDVFLHFDQLSSKENKVILTNNKDEYMRYIPKIIFGNNQNEKFTISTASNLIKSLLKNSNYEYKENKNLSNFFYHGNHFSGTARISSDNKTGVVDTNLKVHGLSNLYICDSSVIPLFGSSNPVFTLITLSKRLAKHLNNVIT